MSRVAASSTKNPGKPPRFRPSRRAPARCTLEAMSQSRDFVEVDGLRIAFERAGDGPPLVLLHGYVGDSRATWQHQLDALSDEFTVVAWDAPGAGQSSDPPESFSLGDFADRLAGFVAALGLERPHVAGLSLGGGLALELYRRHPAVPRTLVLASAYAGWAGSLPPRRPSGACARCWTSPTGRRRSSWPRCARRCSRPGCRRRTADAFAASVGEFHPVGIRALARAFAAADLRDVLPRIEVPTLLLYGDQDVRAPVAVGEALHAAIPASRLVVLPGIGHLISLEAPGRFNAELRAFLRS